MLLPLLLGSITVVVTMGIQVVAVVLIIRYLIVLMAKNKGAKFSFKFDTYSLSVVMLMLFAGHLLQITIWALLFMQLGEFDSLHTAFYHSAVNFASLGYGDIVMSEKWRLLGALEASNGVLMFGLSAGAMLSVMLRIFDSHRSAGYLTGRHKTE